MERMYFHGALWHCEWQTLNLESMFELYGTLGKFVHVCSSNSLSFVNEYLTIDRGAFVLCI